MGIKIYVSITTILDNWQQMIRDINKLNITEACFFPTSVIPKYRPQIYRALEKSCLKRIPLVHLKTDFTLDELHYFQDRWQTRFFNIHSKKQYPLENDLSSRKDAVLMENSSVHHDNEPGEWGGLCLDFSHLEIARHYHPNLFSQTQISINKYPIKAAHLGAFHCDPRKTEHLYTELSQFDYLKQYKHYFPELCALELENSIPQQLAAKEYLEQIL